MDDRELRRLFDELRAADVARAPSLAATMDGAALDTIRRRRRTSALQRGVALAGLAAVIVRGARWRAHSSGTAPVVTPIDIDLGSVTWRAPSDFLLDVPGGEFLRGVPGFGAGVSIALPATTEPPPAESADIKRRSDT